MNPKNKLAEMPIRPLLYTMAVPLMLSLLVQSLYNIVDSIFVARLSETALTAASLVYAICICHPVFDDRHWCGHRRWSECPALPQAGAEKAGGSLPCRHHRAVSDAGHFAGVYAGGAAVLEPDRCRPDQRSRIAAALPGIGLVIISASDGRS